MMGMSDIQGNPPKDNTAATSPISRSLRGHSRKLAGIFILVVIAKFVFDLFLNRIPAPIE